MGYIEEIRSLAGCRPLILNSSAAIIKNTKNELLLVFRQDTNNWGLCGGYMELGETFEDTIKRELSEELQADRLFLTLLGIFSGEEFYHSYPNGDEVYSVIALFEAEIAEEDLEADGKEISRYKHFPENSLPDNITKTTKMLLEKYIQVKKAAFHI